MDQRSAALLTKSQREGLLRGLGSSSSDRKLRQRINTRVKDSTVDLRLLFFRMEEEELEKAFRPDFSALEKHMERLRDIRIGVHEHSRRTSSIPSNIYNLAELLEKYTDTIEELQQIEADLNKVSDKTQDQSQMSFKQQTTDQFYEPEDEIEFLREEILEKSHDAKNVMVDWKDEVEKVRENLQAITNSSDELQLFLGEDYTRFIEGVKRMLAHHEELEMNLETLLNRTEEVERLFDSEEYTQREITLAKNEFVEYVNRIKELLDQRLYNERLPIQRRRAQQLRDSEPDIREAMEILHNHLRKQVFSPSMRDNVVKSVGFYLRVCDAVGANLEQLLEEAIKSTISTHRQNEVLDSVSVNIKTESKDKAIKSAHEKIGKYHLSNAELRALAGSDTDILVGVDDIDTYSLRDQLFERLLEDPDLLNSKIDITEIEPTIEYHGMPVRTDLMGKDAKGNTVLIDIHVDPSQNLTAELQRMQLLINTANKDGAVRGIIVVPRDEIDEDESIATDEFPDIDIYPA